MCYERASFSPTVQTFFLSAIWHGVYPGYYLTFLTGVLMTVAARAVSMGVVPAPQHLGLGYRGERGWDHVPGPALSPVSSALLECLAHRSTWRISLVCTFSTGQV